MCLVLMSEHSKGATKARAASVVVCAVLVSFLSGCGASGLAPNPSAIPGADHAAQGASRPRLGGMRPDGWTEGPGSEEGTQTTPMTHVLTWGQLGGVLGTHNVTWAQ